MGSVKRGRSMFQKITEKWPDIGAEYRVYEYRGDDHPRVAVFYGPEAETRADKYMADLIAATSPNGEMKEKVNV